MNQTDIAQKAGADLHPLWLRLMHWTNAIAVIILIMSGWQIYNATQFMGFKIPPKLALGGWLGGGIQWHFAAMWVLVFNGLLYLGVNIYTKRLWRQFFPINPKAVITDLFDAFKGRLGHDLKTYNAVQKLAYVFVMLDLVVIVLSGLVLWKSVQFPLLREAMGGYEGARLVHFFAMVALCGFILVHVIMALLVPKSIIAMIWGYVRPHAPTHKEP